MKKITSKILAGFILGILMIPTSTFAATSSSQNDSQENISVEDDSTHSNIALVAEDGGEYE